MEEESWDGSQKWRVRRSLTVLCHGDGGAVKAPLSLCSPARQLQYCMHVVKFHMEFTMK